MLCSKQVRSWTSGYTVSDFILRTMDSVSAFSTPENVISPWDKILREYGWTPERQNEFDDDEFTVSFVGYVVYLLSF